MESIFYALLAILGLGFLVFIHELGHFWIARREGMRVEAFSIGFGKPIYTWERGGVKWMLCILPFGGYVRIAGMQKEGSREPYEISDGFYAKRPWQRIKVALAGPMVNILFALAAFTFLWSIGGRPKQFAEFTNRIGWVDPNSVLYTLGVRPGDVIQRYDDRPFHGFKDLLVASLMNDKQMRIEGYKMDYVTGKRVNFDYTLNTYESPQISKDRLQTIGVFSPASYLIYDGQEELFADSPIARSGIEKGDRIIWADGEAVFSVQQLSALTNESTAFLTVQRGSHIFHTKIPRIQLEDLKMKPFERAEIGDWQYEAGVKGKLQDLYFIPYNLSPDCVVESKVDFLDPAEQTAAFQKCQRCSYFTPLEEGDRILAIDGIPLKLSYQLLEDIQTRRVLLIVKRDPPALKKILWTRADSQFEDFNLSALSSLTGSIGIDNTSRHIGDLYVLSPIIPKSKSALSFTSAQQAALSRELTLAKKEIESIRDPVKRSAALKQLENGQKRLVLGVPLRDREVIYNPNPLQQFQNVLVDTWRTLSGLFSGSLKPKYMSGPVGIVHVVHQSWMVGIKEAVFWMAVISLNLGIVNLLPIPVLDGGHIMFSLLEMIRKRPIRSKTMERLILPFIGLLIAFFIYITYQDLARLFSQWL
ncbi:MAG TPA: site-2 protease family protein [Chlamydiales bacterium]|nr:site-2 protease family protein [Chlamydiales bacterium]